MTPSEQPQPEGEVLPAPTNPLAVARQLLDDWQTPDGALVRRRWRGTWMGWRGTRWEELDEVEVRAQMYRRLEHALYVSGVDKNNLPILSEWAPTKGKIANLLDAMGALSLLPAAADAPARICTDAESDIETTAQDEGPIVACENGLLRIRDRQLLPHDPGFFNLVSVPFAYDPTAQAPAWEHFLHQLWPDDPDAIAALQEWFGYVLSGRTDQQKILLVIGPTRSGKGTVARILTELVGSAAVAGPTLAGMGTNFGLSTLIGKPLGLISDARLEGGGGQVVERLLTISGEDRIDIDRKYREVWTGKLPTRLMILSNTLPNFGDSSGVIARRFIVLNLTRSWLGREDTSLTGKLAAEMPGILNWALDGLERLEETGHLTQPASSHDTIVTMQDTASPISAFVRERCHSGPECTVPVEALWSAWKDWAEDSGIPPGTKQALGRNLQAVVPGLRRARPRAEGKQLPVYTGITLAPTIY